MTPEDAVHRLAASPSTTGLFLDFDGTLAPIVDDPEGSTMPPALAPVLTDLAQQLGAVAVVSGRPASFLAGQVDSPTVRLYGLYGLEEWRDGQRVPRAEAAAWQDAVERARAALADRLADAEGLYVEDKGLGVAVHWRNAPDHAAAEARVREAVERQAAATGLAVEPGKLVLELRPPVDWDKGACVRSVADELGLDPVAYVGDDLGDLPAFAAARDRGGLSIAVAHGPETPPELAAAADVVLDGNGAVADLLRDLAVRLRG